MEFFWCQISGVALKTLENTGLESVRTSCSETPSPCDPSTATAHQEVCAFVSGITWNHSKSTNRNLTRKWAITFLLSPTEKEQTRPLNQRMSQKLPAGSSGSVSHWRHSNSLFCLPIGKRFSLEYFPRPGWRLWECSGNWLWSSSADQCLSPRCLVGFQDSGSYWSEPRGDPDFLSWMAPWAESMVCVWGGGGGGKGVRKLWSQHWCRVTKNHSTLYALRLSRLHVSHMSLKGLIHLLKMAWYNL